MNNFYIVNQNRQNSHIIFVKSKSSGVINQNGAGNQNLANFNLPKKSPSYKNKKFGSQFICLLDKISDINLFQKIPKKFTISTNTGSSKFNSEMLLSTSTVISDFFKENPQNYQYHIDIDDPDNVLSKISQIYLGEIVTFNEEQLPISQKISKLLNFTCFPNFLKPESMKCKEYEIPQLIQNGPILSAGLKMSEFYIFLQKVAPKSFIIKTNKHEYECNIFGILSSTILYDKIMKNPSETNYFYDFDDEFVEFKPISDFFNFKTVSLTIDNMKTIQEIAEDFQIECILEDIDKFINERENISKIFDEQQTIVDTVEELFDNLYNIKEKTVIEVKKFIEKSKWSKTEDDIRELAASIIQIIKKNFLLHSYIFDLLLLIDKESNESSQLKILFPFIISMLIYSTFGSLANAEKQSNKKIFALNNSMKFNYNTTSYAFIYRLLKNGIIQKEEITKYLSNYDFTVIELNLWFLPELIELFSLSTIEKQFTINQLKNKSQLVDHVKSFISSFLPDKIDLYKKMRDDDKPTDLLTRSLRDDDIDTFQSIVTNSQIDLINTFVPFNIFENFIENGNTRYLNYAAAYGSLKIFKFLLLNHDDVDNVTFSYAVFGGNTEIIKIVHQKISNENNDYPNLKLKIQNQSQSSLQISDKIYPAIMKHRNDLFDWIFEQDIFDKDQNKDKLISYLKYSVENGNVHSLFEIIEKGFNFGIDQKIDNYILCAANNGFYHIVQFLFNFVGENYNFHFPFNLNSVFSFGNLSILKLFLKFLKQEQLERNLIFVIKREYMSIIKYYFDTLLKKDFVLSQHLSLNILKESIANKTSEIFEFLFDQIKILNPSIFDNTHNLDDLLLQICKFTKNVEIAKTFTEIILEKRINFDFTPHFLNAAINSAIDICKYFIEKKVQV